MPDWVSLVGLVGEGQEIHTGEEGGLEQWDVAISPPNASANWTVHCPPRLAPTFERQDVVVHDRLDLTVSLRSRQAEHLHAWVAALLDGDLSLCARRIGAIVDSGFDLYLTRDLDDARDHIRWRYLGEPDRRYGLLASSHAKNLKPIGIDNTFMATSRLNIATWFNAEATDPRSSCALTQPVTEFDCQGLELDLPLVCWGTDHRWTGTAWSLTPVRRRDRQEDPEQLLRNAYRVLLTRGRDGVVVFLPDDRTLDPTEHALLAAGARLLPEPVALGLTDVVG